MTDPAPRPRPPANRAPAASAANILVRDGAGAVAVAVVCFLLVVRAIDSGGDYPNRPAGPGLTFDESFNVDQGVYLVTASRELGLSMFTLRGAAEVFDQPAYLPDHPPLGRFWIGAGHELTRSLCPPVNTDELTTISAARTAPASAFAALAGLVTFAATRWYGLRAGLIGGLTLLCMPRVFGHAHIASLESFVGLTWTSTVVCLGSWWRVGRRPSTLSAVACGAVFGLALLSKIQAVLLPVPMVVWALWHFRHRAIVPLIVSAMSALVVLFLFWPWLWLDPIGHLGDYLGRTTDRVKIDTWYLGQRYADRDVPWHYPFAMFLATIPVGTLIAGCAGLAAGKRGGWRQPRERLLLLCSLAPLVVFAIPGVAVYDGVRLFLVVYPLWALLAARGWMLAFRRFKAVTVVATLAICLAPAARGTAVISPLQLSWYNVAVGGLDGADSLGLERTYWGDSLTRDFWQRVPRDSTVYVAPVLHQFYLDVLGKQVQVVRDRNIRLEPFYYDYDRQPGLVLLIRRNAAIPRSLWEPPEGSRVVAEVTRDGVQLAVLYDTSIAVEAAPSVSDRE